MSLSLLFVLTTWISFSSCSCSCSLFFLLLSIFSTTFWESVTAPLLAGGRPLLLGCCCCCCCCPGCRAAAGSFLFFLWGGLSSSSSGSKSSSASEISSSCSWSSSVVSSSSCSDGALFLSSVAAILLHKWKEQKRALIDITKSSHKTCTINVRNCDKGAREEKAALQWMMKVREGGGSYIPPAIPLPYNRPSLCTEHKLCTKKVLSWFSFHILPHLLGLF